MRAVDAEQTQAAEGTKHVAYHPLIAVCSLADARR